MDIRPSNRDRKPHELQLTAMVDIVFLLLVFFVMTFRIVDMEGDFQIEMPTAVGVVESVDVPPIHVRLQADETGKLAALWMNDARLSDVDDLRRRVQELVAGPHTSGIAASHLEVILDCDYRLDYRHTIDAITAVSGYRDAGGTRVPMIHKIRFAPPRTDC